jgi:predicted MFS family arabinose efflux permease
MSKLAITFGDTFAALRHRNYRLWFIGQLTSLVGTWMQNTAQSYLIYKLTGSSAYVGYVGLAYGLPAWFFMLYGGVIIEHTPRRTLLLITQATMMLLAAILAALVFSGLVQPWHIIVLAFFLGVANAFDAPARISFVTELVGQQDLNNAIALNATMFNIATILGPMVAAETYQRFGPAWCFTFNAISFIAVIAALLRMKIAPNLAPTRKATALREIIAGLRYVSSHRIIRILILSLGVGTLLGFSAYTLMPAWSEKVLLGDEKTYGALLTSRGVGAVAAALTLAALGRRSLRGKLWTVGSLLFPAALLCFGFIRWTPLALPVIVVMGWSWINFVNNSNALVQTLVSDEYRGRVMSLYTLTFFGLTTIGSPLAGQAAELVGESVVVISSAVILLVYGVFVWIRFPDLRRQA